VFRDGAKTTILRSFAAKRIAYGLAHTILYIGKSEGHAIRSVKWLRNQVEHNRAYRETFQLRKGKKWQDIEAEIWHGTDEYPIWIMAMGITGSVRGINQDDFRPDLIIIDDVIDDENASTAEQRLKIENLILGALKESLAPASEAPHAKIVMLQTPLNKEDASCKALDDGEWTSAVFGCWTKRTANLPLNKQESSWEVRYPSETLRAQKEAAIARNKLSVFLREKECRLTSPETSAFNIDWLQYYELAPEHMTKVVAVDPVPPPTEKQIAKGLRGKDYEVFAAVGMYKGNFYLLEYEANRGHEPDWSIATFFTFGIKWRPRTFVVETTAYQKTLAWIFKKAMKVRRQYYVIKEFDDRRSKYDRIVDGLSGPAFNRTLFVRPTQFDFIEQFTNYPDVSHDDIIEAVSVAVSELDMTLRAPDDNDDAWSNIVKAEEDIPALVMISGAP